MPPKNSGIILIQCDMLTISCPTVRAMYSFKAVARRQGNIPVPFYFNPAAESQSYRRLPEKTGVRSSANIREARVKIPVRVDIDIKPSWPYEFKIKWEISEITLPFFMMRHSMNKIIIFPSIDGN